MKIVKVNENLLVEKSIINDVVDIKFYEFIEGRNLNCTHCDLEGLCPEWEDADRFPCSQADRSDGKNGIFKELKVF